MQPQRISPGDLIRHRYHHKLGLATVIKPIDIPQSPEAYGRRICNVLVVWFGDEPKWVPMGHLEKIN